MSVSKRLRFEILRRDNHTCRYCGAAAPDVKLVVDHVVPEALGGLSEPGNLVTSCEPCNSGKSSIAPDSPLVQDVQQDALRWARAMAAAAAIHAAKREERQAYRTYFVALWSDWHYGPSKQPIPLDDDWQSSIDKFFGYDLHPDDLAYAVRTAMEHRRVRPDNTFRYFCGICWNIIRDIQRTATDLVMASVEDDFEPTDGEG